MTRNISELDDALADWRAIPCDLRARVYEAMRLYVVDRSVTSGQAAIRLLRAAAEPSADLFAELEGDANVMAVPVRSAAEPEAEAKVCPHVYVGSVETRMCFHCGTEAKPYTPSPEMLNFAAVLGMLGRRRR